MDEDNNPDRLLSEPPEQPSQPQERTSSLSLEPSAPIDEKKPVNGGEPETSAVVPPPPQSDLNAQIVREVVNSEVSAESSLYGRLQN
jgi:hypothetical protein